jgi:hypothetical protein
MVPFPRVALLLFAGLVSALIAPAQEIPLANWTVPPYAGTSASGRLSTMADISPAVAFTAIQPCRVVDTRGGGVFTGTYGPPMLAASATRSFDINSAPHCPGIPEGSDAYSLNFTVTQTAGAPGDIRVWPTGQPPVQLTSVLNWTIGNATVANATIMPAGTNGFVDVEVEGSATHLVIDINGYFSDELNPGQSFMVRSATSNPAVLAYNTSSSDYADAIYGELTSTASGVDSAAVSGYNNTANANGFGVWGGHAGQGTGVYGTSPSGTGVKGISRNAAVEGRLLDSSDAPIARGYLGANFGADPPGSAPWAVYAAGDIGASGTKHFREPHPTDPARVISYTSLEGPEAGTYFRGRARFENGLARIVVPEDFRMVTASEGLTVQITPIGGVATVGVLRMDLDEIVVGSSRNLEFSYLVQGVRASFPDEQPIILANDFVPQSRDSVMPGWLSQRQKRLLVENGTYNADGTVNMETARRLGWERMWEAGTRPEPTSAARR